MPHLRRNYMHKNHINKTNRSIWYFRHNDMIYILQINVRKCKLGFKYTTPYNISFTESFTESCSSYLYGANALNFVSNGAVLTEHFTSNLDKVTQWTMYHCFFHVSFWSLYKYFWFFLYHLCIILFILSICWDKFYLTLICHSMIISHFSDICKKFSQYCTVWDEIQCVSTV